MARASHSVSSDSSRRSPRLPATRSLPIRHAGARAAAPAGLRILPPRVRCTRYSRRSSAACRESIGDTAASASTHRGLGSESAPIRHRTPAWGGRRQLAPPPSAADIPWNRPTPSCTLRRHRLVRVAFFRTNLHAGFAADAVPLICNGHDFLLIFVVVILDIRRQRNELAVLTDTGQLQYIPTSNLEAAPTADALFLIDLFDELRRPAASVRLA